MAIDLLKRVRKKVANHVVDFAQQTVLHGPSYFINHGAIKGHRSICTVKDRNIKMSRFDRLVDYSHPSPNTFFVSH